MENLRELAKRGTDSFPYAHYNMHTNKYCTFTELHWHTEIEIIYATEGQFEITIANNKYIASPGDIFFINPGELHMLKSYSLPVKYHAAVFSLAMLECNNNSFFQKEIIAPLINGEQLFKNYIKRNDNSNNEIKQYIKKIFLEDNDTKYLVFPDLVGLLSSCKMNNIFQSSDSNYLNKKSNDIKQCIQFMEDNYANKISLSQLSSLVNISPNYFCRFFKQYTSVSPFTQLTKIRIKKASSLLIKSDDAIINIASDCGFDNLSYFIRQFKKINGTTPSSYRKKYYKNNI